MVPIMPCDYSKYSPEWKTEIRPRILERDGHKCKFCKVPNHKLILRGDWNGVDAYQDDNGYIYDGSSSERIGEDYVGEVDSTGRNRFIKIVLTIAHLNHDVEDNRDENLAATCQRCHNRHDISHRKENRKKNKGQLPLL